VTNAQPRPTVHATVAQLPFILWGMSFVFDLASIWRGPAMVEAALFNLAAGLIAALAAGVTGARDYVVRLGPASRARRLAGWHALVDGVATALFACSLVARWPARGAAPTPRLPFVLSALGVAMMAVGSYLGGLTEFEARDAELGDHGAPPP
jgi:uncharacterized membrane protein